MEKKLGPFFKKLFPSFIYVHYAYITFCAILGSILIYPQKNIPYIDALFFGSGCATQAGLNTINVNDLTLFQQMVMYIMCFITTPIFIHGFILLLRLYWFERHFDDIKTTSKLNHKMRRTATLLQIHSQQTMGTFPRSASINLDIPEGKNPAFSTSADVFNNQNAESSPDSNKEAYASSDSSHNNNNTEANKIFNGALNHTHTSLHSTTESDNSDPHHLPQRVISRVDSDDPYNNVAHLSEPSDSEPELEKRAPDDIDHSHHNKDIKFADLPHPNKRHKDIEPSDMYMSIAMMQNNRKLHHPEGDEDENGPALVIQGPLERQRKYGRKKRHMRHHRKPHVRKFKYNLNLDENIDEIEMGTMRRKSFIQFKVPKGRTMSGVIKASWNKFEDRQHENAVSDGEDVVDSINSDGENTSENDEDYRIAKAQTNLIMPSSDQTNGLKYSKRANTLDVNPMRRPSMGSRAPTFDRIFRSRRKNKRHMRRYSSSVDDDDDSYDDDDEEDSDIGSRNLVSGNYLSWNPTVARNSTFVALTDDQKEELGGVEYRAVKLLSKIVVIYYVGFHIVALICFLPFILKMPHYSTVMRDYGISPTWWGFFTPASVFNDLGYTLNPDSMYPFYQNAYFLLILGFFIIIGNTGFPILLRFIIWILFKLSKNLSLFKESLGFLLDHPRRCFTLLFPSVPTWWLFFILVVLNAIDLVLFIILDLNNSALTSIPAGYRVLDGLFQAFSTRTAGFSVIDLSRLHPSVQVSYMLMMYISVLPLAISIRRTNVYEEQSLGIYGGNNDATDAERTPQTFIATHLRNQLSFDLWFIFLGLFIICIADGGKLQRDDIDFTVFQVLFEIVSAYGTVGLSLGYPNTNTSFSAQFSVISKLVIIAMMIRGRHRGLPYSLDRAIILPSDKMNKIDLLQERYGHASRVNTMNTTESRTRTNLFSRVKTLRSGIFNIGGSVDHSNWIDSRLPHNEEFERLRTQSVHHPPNITFTLGQNSTSQQRSSDPVIDDISSIESQMDRSPSPRHQTHSPRDFAEISPSHHSMLRRSSF